MADKRKYKIRQLWERRHCAHVIICKTTTTEGVLYHTGLKHKIGAVHEGNHHGLDGNKASARYYHRIRRSFYWKVKQINIIVLGHIDFTAEVERSLR